MAEITPVPASAQREVATQVKTAEAIIEKSTSLPSGTLDNVRGSMERVGVPTDQIDRAIVEKAETIKSPK